MGGLDIKDLLADFLVESGELVDDLGDQLIQLEKQPDDAELLNAVFRAFHTVKGGAGFMELEPMVVLCHRAEEVFDALRHGEVALDADMMDVALEAVDVLTGMMDELNDGGELEAPSAALLKRLETAAKNSGDTAQHTTSVSQTTAPAATATPSDPADAEFEAFLSQATPNVKAIPQQNQDGAPADGKIGEDEFEALLDELHGEGKAPGAVSSAGGSSGASAPDTINDDEFEALLDELHGAGQGPGAESDKASAAPDEKAIAKTANEASQLTDKKTSVAVASGKDKLPARHSHAKTSRQDATIRVDTQRLDKLINLAGELVLARNRLLRLRPQGSNAAMDKAVVALDLITNDMQSAVMGMRMQPVKKLFSRFPKLVRELARNLGKKVDLELSGEDTELDKSLVDSLSDPLVHLLRNALDHGIEKPEVRRASGKSEVGNVHLRAAQQGEQIVIAISDDGGGMDADALRDNAIEKGVIGPDEANRLTPDECYELIFMPGFSTKTEVSNVSGRGVGMDVVKNRIAELNGLIEVTSALGRGSEIKVSVPLTLAILPTLMVRVMDRIFALPVTNIGEVFELDKESVRVLDGKEVIMVRGRALPLVFLDTWICQGGVREPVAHEEHVVIVQSGSQRVALVVDDVQGREEVVIKPLGSLLHSLRGLAGATITGDGRIALILDFSTLFEDPWAMPREVEA